MATEAPALKVWDAHSGREDVKMRGDATEAFGAAFSPDGRWIATGEHRGAITVWDPTTGKAEHELNTRYGRVYSLTFSPPDGRRLAALTTEGMVIVYDTTQWDAAPLYFQAHHVSVRGSLAFDSEGKRLVMPGDDNTVNIWDATFTETPPSEPLLLLRGHTKQVWGVAFSPNGHWVASGGEDNTVRIWDAATGELKRTLFGHTNFVSRVAFSQDNQYLASASFDKTVKIWELSTVLRDVK
jgi:WD40 repeat protein